MKAARFLKRFNSKKGAGNLDYNTMVSVITTNQPMTFLMLVLLAVC